MCKEICNNNEKHVVLCHCGIFMKLNCSFLCAFLHFVCRIKLDFLPSLTMKNWHTKSDMMIHLVSTICMLHKEKFAQQVTLLFYFLPIIKTSRKVLKSVEKSLKKEWLILLRTDVSLLTLTNKLQDLCFHKQNVTEKKTVSFRSSVVVLTILQL